MHFLVMVISTLLLCRGYVLRRRFCLRMMSDYTINEYSENEIIVEKSKFISKIGRVTSIEEANDFIQVHKDVKASHNCYSYRLRDGLYTKGSDDGEPSGTAALPIKKAIGEDFVDIIVLVTRYFGGIKLGTGGLSRAYYDCAKAGLEKVNKVKLIDYKTIKLTADIGDISVVYHAINTINLVKLNELFNADNTVTVLANADIANIVEIEKELTKICKGKVKFVF